MTSNHSRLFVAVLTSLAVLLAVQASPLAPQAVADEPIILEPIRFDIGGMTEPLILEGDLTVSFPVIENDTAAASHCFPVGEGSAGTLCVGTPDVGALPPLDVVGLEEMTPLVKGGRQAEHALNWIVAEGISVLRGVYDLPNDERILRYARPQLRTYIVERLIDIMDRKVYGIPLTADEQRALTFVENEMLSDDRALAQASYDEFMLWKSDRCSYRPPPAPPSVENPATMPEKVVKWCNRAQHPSHVAFTFAPPIPSAEHFRAWGSYRAADKLGLDVLHDPVVAANSHGMAQTGVALGGMALALGAGAAAAALAGSVSAISAGMVALIGSQAAVPLFVAKVGYLPVTAAVSAVGAAAAATIVAAVIFALVLTAVSIWQLVEHESVGVDLKQDLDDATAATDPLGLEPLTAIHSGKPLNSDLDPDAPPSYRTQAAIGKLITDTVLWTSVNERRETIADPTRLYPSNQTTGDDIQLVQKVGSGEARTVRSVTIPLEDGPAEIRFHRGWMIVDPASGPPRPALSVTYLDASRESTLLTRAPSSLGGFYLTRADKVSKGITGEHVKKITFLDAARREVTVRLLPVDFQRLEGPRPSAVGPLLAGRPVILRPNPVNLDGTTMPADEAESRYGYDWSVRRFDRATGELVDAAASKAFGPRFTPVEAGQYEARVTMSDVDEPTLRKHGLVEFTVQAPPMEETTLALLDDGVEDLEVDLQVTEPVANDDVRIVVTWPGDIGSQTRPTTVLELPCQQSGPVECTTQRTGPSDLLQRRITTSTDLRQPVLVRISNGYGATEVHELHIDSAERPRIAAPEAGSNDDEKGGVTVGESTIQVEMPLADDTPYYIAARLVPGVGTGDDFALVDPATGFTVANLTMPGTRAVHASVVEDDDGTWRLVVWGTPGVGDLGTYEVPIVIQQTNVARTLAVVVVHVTPSGGERFRGALQSNVDPFDTAVDVPPDLAAAVLGGRVEWPRYRGGMCISLQHTASGPPQQKCGPLSTFFDSDGRAHPFPYAELFPGGMPAGGYRARAWLTTPDAHVDTEPIQMSFHLTEDASYPKPRIELGDPTVSGKPRVGKTLRASVDSVSPPDALLRYRWLRDGSRIRGATDDTYTIRRADRGHRLSVKVIAKKAGWRRDVEVSPTTRRIKRR